MADDDEDTVRRLLGIKLIEAARKAGADPVPQPSPPAPSRDTDDRSDHGPALD